MATSAGDETIAGELLAVLESVAPRPLTVQELARRLDLERYDRRALARLLEAEVVARKLRRVGKTRYQWLRPVDVARVSRRARPAPAPPAQGGPRAPEGEGARRRAEDGPRSSPPDRRQPSRQGATLEGRYSQARGGFGFVEVLGPAARGQRSDVFVPAGMAADALHGDLVEVEVQRTTRGPRGAVRRAGRVVALVRRASEVVVGVLQRGGLSPRADRGRPPRGRVGGPPAARRAGWHLVPENELLPLFAIEGGALPRDEDEGRVAVARLLRGPSPLAPPAAALERVLGDANDPEVQFLTIALEHGLRVEFPPEVLAEAEALPLDPSPQDDAGREDLRHLPFVTIDGETARDFDDAVCLEALGGGRERLWVAIADVSHYVRPGSALDAEAVLRGTSVYFPDRAIPMLPERLSTGLCSLNPKRDRLVVAACLAYEHGERREARFVRGVIQSRARLTYTQVAAVLSESDAPGIAVWREELAPLLDQLARMHALMRTLLARRVAAGSLDLDLPEALVDLSEEGRSVGVRLSQRNDAHRMIEEFMLEANQAVARFLRERDVPLPYRIHEPPAPTSIDELNEFLQAFGARVEYDEEVRPQDVQSALHAIAAHPLSRVLSRQVLRALMQARYSTENVGHFGLAFPTYCHFTSPIRRYPDLLVHRQLGLVLDGEAERAREQAAALELASATSSQREREAVDAERAMLDLKKAEFMLEHLLEPEPAAIVSVAPFGIFVELEAYPVEGLVRSENLPERTVFDEGSQSLVVPRTGERFRLGDRVVVEATDVSLRRRQVGFALLERLTREEGPSRVERTVRRAPVQKARNEAVRGSRRGEPRRDQGSRSKPDKGFAAKDGARKKAKGSALPRAKGGRKGRKR